MIKRFLIVFGLILLFMVLWAGVLLLVFFIAEDADVVALITVPVIFITFIPYVNFIAKNVFHFKGEGAPISGDELRSRIMEINDINVPVMVQKRKKKLIATWKYVDAKWWEILSKAGLKKIIELLMKFNDRKKEVILSDVTKSISWKAGPTKVRVWGGFTRGIALEYEIGKQWGITENFKLGKIYDCKFSSQEIRAPILNSILRSGWDVRLGIW